jgi:SAM-dependent methyltransferase
MVSSSVNANRQVVYPLGHSERELARLNAQESLVGPFTRRFFLDAGIVPGMRVLDVGTGTGHVALLAADLIGDAGEVIGTDKAAGAVAAAQARAEEESRRNVKFLEGDPTEMTFERPFDAVVGRYILMFQAEPAAMLRKLAEHLRPGGVIVFHEPDWESARSFPAAPTYDRCHEWIIKTFRLVGTEARMGIRLHEAFVAAGLPAPTMRLNAIVGGAMGGSGWLDQIAALVATLAPTMERFGVATAAEIGIETLAERLHREVADGRGIIVGRSEIGAWSRRS